MILGGVVEGERLFEVLDTFDLHPPQSPGVERRHRLKAGSHLLIEFGEADEFCGPVDGEDRAAASVGFQGIRELRDLAGRLVGERERKTVVRQARGKAVEVLAGLRLDAGESVPLRLRLDHADRPGVGVEHVIGVTRGERELPHGHSQARRDVHLGVVLHNPASLLKLAVNLLSRFLLGSHAPEFADSRKRNHCTAA